MLDRSELEVHLYSMAAKPKRPRDTNQLAKFIVGVASGDIEPPELKPRDDGKNPAAVALGRLGGLKGGKARAEKLTKAKRTLIAKKAASARWKKNRTS